MPTLEELAQQVAELREQIEEQSGLRASQDRDLSDLATGYRAQRMLLQSMAITQSEHDGKLSDLRREVEKLDPRLARLEARQGQIETKIDGLAGGMQQVVAMLQRLTGE